MTDPIETSAPAPTKPPVADKAAADAKAADDAKAKAKAEADKMRPTPEEIEFVARAMDVDGVVDWENNPEHGDNARAWARKFILGARAYARIGEAKKAAKPTDAQKS